MIQPYHSQNELFTLGWLIPDSNYTTHCHGLVFLDFAAEWRPGQVRGYGAGDISRQFVRDWVADLSVDLAPASVHKTVGVLRQVLAMAVTENRLVINPADGVELPPVSSVEQRFLTLDQLHTLADAAGAHRPLVYVAGTTVAASELFPAQTLTERSSMTSSSMSFGTRPRPWRSRQGRTSRRCKTSSDTNRRG